MTIGKYSYLTEGTILNPWRGAHILVGNFCSIADGQRFLIGTDHNYKSISTFPFDVKFGFRDSPPTPESIKFPPRPIKGIGHQLIIGNDVWIGYGATIFGGIKIGNGAVIGARSVVTKNVPPYSIVVGNPARVIKYRFDSETIKKLQLIRWWNWSLEKIYENLQLMIDSPKEFIDRNYSPELDNIPPDEIGNSIRRLKLSGFKIFSSILDFDMKSPLWKRIAEYFSTMEDKNSILIFHAFNGVSHEQIKTAIDFIDNLDANIIVTKFSHDALLETDVLFTNHSPNTSFAIDLLSAKNCEFKYIVEYKSHLH